MLNAKMNAALNDQIGMEGYASFVYLAISTWCDQKGMAGAASFFRRQSEEENMHMLKIVDYILEMDGTVDVPGIEKPKGQYDNIIQVFEHTLEHEKKVTQSIHKLVDLALETNDHATHNFLQWYVEEQREEETLIRTILDKINLIGDGPMSGYYIDKEVEAINAVEAQNQG